MRAIITRDLLHRQQRNRQGHHRGHHASRVERYAGTCRSNRSGKQFGQEQRQPTKVGHAKKNPTRKHKHQSSEITRRYKTQLPTANAKRQQADHEVCQASPQHTGQVATQQTSKDGSSRSRDLCPSVLSRVAFRFLDSRLASDWIGSVSSALASTASVDGATSTLSDLRDSY